MNTSPETLRKIEASLQAVRSKGQHGNRSTPCFFVADGDGGPPTRHFSGYVNSDSQKIEKFYAKDIPASVVDIYFISNFINGEVSISYHLEPRINTKRVNFFPTEAIWNNPTVKHSPENSSSDVMARTIDKLNLLIENSSDFDKLDDLVSQLQIIRSTLKVGCEFFADVNNIIVDKSKNKPKIRAGLLVENSMDASDVQEKLKCSKMDFSRFKQTVNLSALAKNTLPGETTSSPSVIERRTPNVPSIAQLRKICVAQRKIFRGSNLIGRSPGLYWNTVNN